MPTSTSSKMSVGIRPRPASTTCSARLTRDSPPPEATFVKRFHRLAGIGAHQKLDALQSVRREFALGQRLKLHSNLPPGMPSSCMCCVTCLPSLLAAPAGAGAKAPGELHIRRACIFHLVFKLAEVGVVVFDVVQFGAQAAGDVRQSVRLHAVFAREFVYRSHAPLDLFQPLRIEFEAVEVLVQSGGGFVNLDRGLVKQRLNLTEARVVFGERVEPADGARQAARERLFLVVVQRLGDGLHTRSASAPCARRACSSSSRGISSALRSSASSSRTW